MSALLRTAVRAFIVFALLAAASCSGQSSLTSATAADAASKESSVAGHRGRPGKSKGHSRSCKPSKSRHHRECKVNRNKPKRHLKPKCRCRCYPHGTRNQPPVASVALATVNGTTFDFRPEGSFDPDGTIVKYEWDWESDGVYDFSSADGLATHSFAGGDHTITLRVTDNKGATATATFDLSANFPPTAKISIGTVTGATFFFSAEESSDPEGAIQRWEWDFDGDGIFEEFYFSDPGTITHSFTGGEHEISLRVTDGLDATDTETITLTANFPPVADIDVVNAGGSPDSVRQYELAFDGSSDVEGPIFQFFVTVDGEPQSLSDISEHLVVEVPAGEERTVILTVIDGLDLSDSQMVALTPEGVVYAEE
jgi:hypothetical protein